MAAYYHVRSDDRSVDREVVLGFQTYKKLFAAARHAGAVLLIRCGDFHGIDEFRPHELHAVRAEIARVRSEAVGAPDVTDFLKSLDDLVRYAESRGKSVFAEAD
jgi:hypothetical protein